ncbi:hypothetical protein HY625_01520 [Candidatus Uhrbacteria bacterium]|nr:hypothetical protein [Candidatus Uhrbacteria bacterium]
MPTETMGMETEMLAGFCSHGNNPAECQSCKGAAYENELKIVEKIGPATRVREVIGDKEASQESIKALIKIIEEKFSDEIDLRNQLTDKLQSRVNVQEKNRGAQVPGKNRNAA